MKLWPDYTWQEKQNCVKKFDDDAMSDNFDVINIIPVYSQLGAIWKPHSGRIVCKTYIFINSDLLPCEIWKQN